MRAYILWGAYPQTIGGKVYKQHVTSSRMQDNPSPASSSSPEPILKFSEVFNFPKFVRYASRTDVTIVAMLELSCVRTLYFPSRSGTEV